MAKVKFNHSNHYQGIQPAEVVALYPGMIVQFSYMGDDVFDKNPLILFLYKEEKHSVSKSGLIHGLNLNYLKETQVQRLFCTCELLFKGKSIYSTEPITRKVQSQMSDYDDTLPYRNLLKEEFTRIMLPAFKEKQDGRVLSEAEAKVQMKLLYDKVIKKFVLKNNIYRTYTLSKIRSVKVLKYKLGEWHQSGFEQTKDAHLDENGYWRDKLGRFTKSPTI